MSMLADLSDTAASADIRFFHRPEIVQTKDSTGQNYDAVVIGSGDRANPLESADSNYIFVIKDKAVTSGVPGNTLIDDGDLADVTSCADTCTGLDFANGWKMRLVGTGEKGLSSPLVSSGKIFYTTYTPSTGATSSCAPAEGSGEIYIINLKDGTEVFDGSRGIDIGPGIPASPIALSGDLILLPGTGLSDLPAGLGLNGNGQLLQVGGKSMWILYWHQSGSDSL